MPPSPSVGNRGPAAAAANRHAILDAARRLFAAHGYHVPYRAIALEAGVGQGVLYRHFPTRIDLAYAVFAENLDELEELARDDDPECLLRVWWRLVDVTMESAAFVELAVEVRRGIADWSGVERLPALLAGPLARAQDAGLVPAELTVADLLLVHRMIYGVIGTEVDPSAVRASVRRAIELVSPRLALWSAGRCPAPGRGYERLGD